GVFQIAKEPAHGVEGFSQVRSATPVTAAQGSAISGQSAERSRHADRAARIRTDSDCSGALKNASHRAAGRPSGERRGIVRLQAVAELRIFAGDAIGKRVQVGFADDYGSCG